MSRSALLLAFVSLTAGSLYAGSNPIGQKAHYQVDTNRQRTSSAVRSGSLDVIVDSEVENGYKALINYDLNVIMQGRQTGTEELIASKEFFTPEFIAELRARSLIVTENFKVKHMGYGDARNIDGAVYPNCDKIMIYDVKMPEDFWANDFLGWAAQGQAWTQAVYTDAVPFEDLVVNAMVYAGVPVLGAVKIDLSGKYSGMKIKVGADYLPPAVAAP